MITAGNGPSCSGYVTNVSIRPDGVSMATTRSLMTPDLPTRVQPVDRTSSPASIAPPRDRDGSVPPFYPGGSACAAPASHAEAGAPRYTPGERTVVSDAGRCSEDCLRA